MLYVPERSKELDLYFLDVEREGCMYHFRMSPIALGRCKNSISSAFKISIMCLSIPFYPASKVKWNAFIFFLTPLIFIYLCFLHYENILNIPTCWKL